MTPGPLLTASDPATRQLLQNKKVIAEKKRRGVEIYSLTPKSDRHFQTAIKVRCFVNALGFATLAFVLTEKIK